MQPRQGVELAARAGGQVHPMLRTYWPDKSDPFYPLWVVDHSPG